MGSLTQVGSILSFIPLKNGVADQGIFVRLNQHDEQKTLAVRFRPASTAKGISSRSFHDAPVGTASPTLSI